MIEQQNKMDDGRAGDAARAGCSPCGLSRGRRSPCVARHGSWHAVPRQTRGGTGAPEARRKCWKACSGVVNDRSGTWALRLLMAITSGFSQSRAACRAKEAAMTIAPAHQGLPGGSGSFRQQVRLAEVHRAHFQRSRQAWHDSSAAAARPPVRQLDHMSSKPNQPLHTLAGVGLSV